MVYQDKHLCFPSFRSLSRDLVNVLKGDLMNQKKNQKKSPFLKQFLFNIFNAVCINENKNCFTDIRTTNIF